MGFAISWLAVADKDAVSVLAELGLAPTGEFGDVPESPFATINLSNGWVVVHANGFDSDLVSNASLVRLSSDCRVVSCMVEEHVMASVARFHDHGRLVWQVVHEGEDGPHHLDARGDLPVEFDAIRSRLNAEQTAEDQGANEVDFIFEIPVELAAAICGFRHDRGAGGDFEVLSPVRDATKRGWRLW